MSVRALLIAISLFLGLTLANVIYHRQQMGALQTPYSAGTGVSILAAAAQQNAVADEQRGFAIREIGALLVSGALLLVFSGRSSRSRSGSTPDPRV